MSQSLSLLLVHIVFSTKDRRPWLNDAIRPEMHAYLASVAGAGENFCFRVGGIEDHVHVALLLARNATVAKMVETMKVASSKWIKSRGPDFASFAWQRGYAAFSFGPGDREALLRYIDEQAKHHQRRDFQTEMRALFPKYGVAFDERFVWG
jgi:putative transposase